MVNPSIEIFLSSGDLNSVVIRDVDVRLFSEEPLGNVEDDNFRGKFLHCIFGAGGDSGYYIVADLAASNVEVVEGGLPDSGTASLGQMPPAFVEASNGGFESAIIFFHPWNAEAKYEGQVTVHLVVDGENVTMIYGSVDNPMRWIQTEQQYWAK